MVLAISMVENLKRSVWDLYLSACASNSMTVRFDFAAE